MFSCQNLLAKVTGMIISFVLEQQEKSKVKIIPLKHFLKTFNTFKTTFFQVKHSHSIVMKNIFFHLNMLLYKNSISYECLKIADCLITRPTQRLIVNQTTSKQPQHEKKSFFII